MSTLSGNREPLAAVTINLALKWDRCKENNLPLSFKKSSSSHFAEFALACHPWTEGGAVLSLSRLLLWGNPCRSLTPGTGPTPSCGHRMLLLGRFPLKPFQPGDIGCPRDSSLCCIYAVAMCYLPTMLFLHQICFLELLWWYYHQFVHLDEDTFLHDDLLS